jgi:hypothetical protein
MLKSERRVMLKGSVCEVCVSPLHSVVQRTENYDSRFRSKRVNNETSNDVKFISISSLRTYAQY